MNYVQQLELERSRVHMDRMAKAVGNDPAEFKKIIEIIFGSDPELRKRAAWLLEVIVRDKPELAKPFVRKFIKALTDVEDQLKRGFLKALEKQKIPEDLKAITFDSCIALMLSPDRPVAVKVYAMEVAGNIAIAHPDLKGELKMVIDDQWDKNTAAFPARGRMVLKKLNYKVVKDCGATR